MEIDERTRAYIIPERILWKTENQDADVENETTLLEKKSVQISLQAVSPCILRNRSGRAGILLDFGTELHGGVQLLTWNCGKAKTARLRVRFGESAMEAMSEPGEKNSTNDHAIRDTTVEASFLGLTEIGNTGFRFVRIDLLENNSFLELKSVRAVFVYRDIPYLGSFRCSDPLLNKIWETGARTVHLNMQGYLWDGIKRDRLVWIGDMYPEVSVLRSVFGFDKTVPKSLDFIRDETPLPQWMNGLPSYSMWWILIQHSWYRQNGDLPYLNEQKAYLLPLLKQLEGFVKPGGLEPPQNLFADWSSVGNTPAQTGIFQSLLLLALRASAELCITLNEREAASDALSAARKLEKNPVSHGGSKQAAAMLAVAGLADPLQTNRDILSPGGAKGLSAFLGYFVLQAKAMAGDIPGCLSLIREYWGGMLQLGATSFWEEFDIDWMQNAGRIDEIIAEDKNDVHGDTGEHCYKGYRKSLCHGWAAGPTAWLSEHVLGICILRPGCRKVNISPALGDLQWVEGTYPTPHGLIRVRHEKKSDGTVCSQIEAPEAVTIIRK